MAAKEFDYLLAMKHVRRDAKHYESIAIAGVLKRLPQKSVQHLSFVEIKHCSVDKRQGPL